MFFSYQHGFFYLLQHVTPLAFLRGTGVNDDLDGTESKRAVWFTVSNQNVPRGVKVDTSKMSESPYQMDCEVVQSLAKWKRLMLDRLEIPLGQGLYCDSTSIRKGYKGDVTHSVIADQWDYEIHISRDQRTPELLHDYVKTIWKIITDAEDYILEKYPQILLQGHPTSTIRLPKEITFLTSQELHEMYPDLDVHGRVSCLWIIQRKLPSRMRKFLSFLIFRFVYYRSGKCRSQKVRCHFYQRNGVAYVGWIGSGRSPVSWLR